MVDSALARRPEVASARAEVEAAEFSRRLARKEYFPDFVLGLQWEFGGKEDALGEQMGDSWEVMAGMSLPIWLGKRRAMSREAQAQRESAEHNLDAVHLRVSRDVEASMHGVRSSRERVARFEREILPRAEQAFRSAEAGYRAGRADLLDYLDSERMWLSMRKEYYGVVAELGSQTAALERALGTRE
jgi:outer membrane protein TolC